MIWIDRLAVLWACVVAIPLAIMYYTVPGVGGIQDEKFFVILAVMVLTPWALLRALRFVATGRLRN